MVRSRNPLPIHSATSALLAATEGIEPSTRSFGGSRSTTELSGHDWRARKDLNPQPPGPKPGALVR